MSFFEYYVPLLSLLLKNQPIHVWMLFANTCIIATGVWLIDIAQGYGILFYKGCSA